MTQQSIITEIAEKFYILLFSFFFFLSFVYFHVLHFFIIEFGLFGSFVDKNRTWLKKNQAEYVHFFILFEKFPCFFQSCILYVSQFIFQSVSDNRCKMKRNWYKTYLWFYNRGSRFWRCSQSCQTSLNAHYLLLSNIAKKPSKVFTFEMDDI